MNKESLQDLNLGLSFEELMELQVFNRKQIGRSNSMFSDKVERYIIPPIQDTVLNRKKLEYLNSRLGLSLSYTDLERLKIIPSIASFIRYNKIVLPNINANYINHIEENYIGFLSQNNNYITLRAIVNGLNRYIKIQINPKNLNKNSFFALPNEIDLLYTENIDIHIAEGTFDILSVYHLTDHSKNTPSLYYATSGFGYGTIIKHLIHNGINSNLHIHIYADNDKPDKVQKNELYYRSLAGIWAERIYIHRNTYPNEKDYGVPIARIQDSIYRLK